jgi:hypothetical protein
MGINVLEETAASVFKAVTSFTTGDGLPHRKPDRAKSHDVHGREETNPSSLLRMDL